MLMREAAVPTSVLTLTQLECGIVGRANNSAANVEGSMGSGTVATAVVVDALMAGWDLDHDDWGRVRVLG